LDLSIYLSNIIEASNTWTYDFFFQIPEPKTKIQVQVQGQNYSELTDTWYIDSLAFQEEKMTVNFGQKEKMTVIMGDILYRL